MSDPPRVFLVTLEAVEPPDAAILTVLAFARADDEDTAKTMAAGELRAFGWRDIHALRTGELIDWGALPEDFRASVATALEHGVGLIVYEEP